MQSNENGIAEGRKGKDVKEAGVRELQRGYVQAVEG